MVECLSLQSRPEVGGPEILREMGGLMAMVKV
jgi:hypothetical protein